MISARYELAMVIAVVGAVVVVVVVVFENGIYDGNYQFLSLQ